MNKHNYSISEQAIIETIKNKKIAQKRLTHAEKALYKLDMNIETLSDVEKEIQSDLLKNLASKKAANKAIRSSLNRL